MKWIILVYLTVAAGTTEGDISYTRLEHPAKDFQECIDIEQQINDLLHRERYSFFITMEPGIFTCSTIRKSVKVAQENAAQVNKKAPQVSVVPMMILTQSRFDFFLTIQIFLV